MTANDISRWCTVWSLLERGTYAIDECPWQIETQDKVQRPPKMPDGGAGPASAGASTSIRASPPLISTVIAGMLYPARRLIGVPLDRVVLQERAERSVQKPDPDHPGRLIGVLETPKEPVKWPAYVLYFNPVLIVLNVIPYASSWSSSPGCSTGTRPTTGRGSSAWSPRRSAPTCCRTPRR